MRQSGKHKMKYRKVNSSNKIKEYTVTSQQAKKTLQFAQRKMCQINDKQCPNDQCLLLPIQWWPHINIRIHVNYYWAPRFCIPFFLWARIILLEKDYFMYKGHKEAPLYKIPTLRGGRRKMKNRKVNSRNKIKEYSHFTTRKENFAVCTEENVSDKW